MSDLIKHNEPTLSPLLARYYTLRQSLGIDLIDLDRAFEQTPPTLREAGELAAKAMFIENEAKHNPDIAVAAAADDLRQALINGKEPSQTRIDSLIPLDAHVQRRRRDFDQARYEAAVCVALYKAFESQSRLITKASDMVISGYISPSVALDQRRAEIRRASAATPRRGASAGSPGQPQESDRGRPVS